MDRAEYQQMLALVQDLEAKYAARVAGQQATDAAPQRTLEARPVEAAFLHIALLCKRALEQPPFSPVHRQYFFDIARVCRRFLEREG